MQHGYNRERRMAKKIRKAVIPAAAPVLHLPPPEAYSHASEEREYGVALVFADIIDHLW